MAPELIFPEEELAVTTPRQLAPTVGPMMKGVEIVGAARRAMEKLAIGRVYTDEHGETEIDDSGWTSEMNEVDEGYQFVFGRINVFVGMVSTSGIRSNSAESVSEPTVVVESDGEESVGTSEVGIIAESEEEQYQAEKPEMLQDSVQIQITMQIQSLSYPCLKIGLGMVLRKRIMRSRQYAPALLESTCLETVEISLIQLY